MSLSNFFPSFLVPSRTAMEAAAPSSSPRNGSSSRSKVRSKKENTKDVEWTVLLADLLLNLGAAVLLAVSAQWIIKRYFLHLFIMQSPDNDTPSSPGTLNHLRNILQRREEEKHGAAAAAKVKIQLPELDQYELHIASSILDPHSIDVTFADVGGLQDIKEELYQLVIYPLLQPQHYTHKLHAPTRGILLYGKPGTGKTMLAKALAAEAQAVFVPLPLSKILSKWVGESNKLVAGAFSLAHKLQPSILFVDEMDTFLKSSSGTDGAAYLDTVKSEFLNLWDGVATARDSHVLVLGATNQPYLLDDAIARRMPRQFEVPLPNRDARLDILRKCFDDDIDMTIDARAYLATIADATVQYSGSDLHELAKVAASVRLQERAEAFCQARVRQRRQPNRRRAKTDKKAEFDFVPAIPAEQDAPLRPIAVRDLQLALQKVARTGAAAHDYGVRQARDQQQQKQAYNTNPTDLLNALLAAMHGQQGSSEHDESHGSHNDGDGDDACPNLEES